MSAPRCSIIVPAYNVEAYVAQSVRSALEQTFTDHEVIVVNDGSTDGTADVLRRFGSDIIYIEQPNRGVAAARNTGIRAARADRIALLDADDVWFPHRLERLMPFLDDHPEYGAVTTIYLGRGRRYYLEDQGPRLVQANFLAAMGLFRSEVFEAHGYCDEELRGCVDWELWIRLALGGVRIGVVRERLHYYRRRLGSITSDWRAHLANEAAMFDRLIAKGYDVPGLEGRLHFARGRYELARGEWKRARSHLASALRDPSLAAPNRVKALAFVAAPRVGWKVYSALVDRAMRRKGARSRDRVRRLGFDPDEA